MKGHKGQKRQKRWKGQKGRKSQEGEKGLIGTFAKLFIILYYCKEDNHSIEQKTAGFLRASEKNHDRQTGIQAMGRDD
ncbi:MAG: hypothetical protein K6G44_11920, partial [Lentisphaeria bacterium]|nr:hypothetical protein [Lentisphaeria bacterium]